MGVRRRLVSLVHRLAIHVCPYNSKRSPILTSKSRAVSRTRPFGYLSATGVVTLRTSARIVPERFPDSCRTIGAMPHFQLVTTDGVVLGASELGPARLAARESNGDE